MASNRAYKKSRRGGSTSFAGIPRADMMHPDYIGLKASPKCLLQELAYQYRGNNNGDLTLAPAVMKTRGFNSPSVIDRAKKALLEAGMIIETRKGRFINPGGVCSLYALTWNPIDECNGKLECNSTIKAPRSFKLNHPIPKEYPPDTESVSMKVNLNEK